MGKQKKLSELSENKIRIAQWIANWIILIRYRWVTVMSTAIAKLSLKMQKVVVITFLLTGISFCSWLIISSLVIAPRPADKTIPPIGQKTKGGAGNQVSDSAKRENKPIGLMQDSMQQKPKKKTKDNLK